jgi:hypothetical protein
MMRSYQSMRISGFGFMVIYSLSRTDMRTFIAGSLFAGLGAMLCALGDVAKHLRSERGGPSGIDVGYADCYSLPKSSELLTPYAQQAKTLARDLALVAVAAVFKLLGDEGAQIVSQADVDGRHKVILARIAIAANRQTWPP